MIIRRKQAQLNQHGTTRNISRSGALLEIEITHGSQLIQEGEELSIEIALDDSMFGRKCMYCRGRVTRAYAVEEMTWRMALSFGMVEFRDASRLEASPVPMPVM